MSDLLNFQQDGLDYLYHLEPTQNNLFYVGSFQCENTSGEPSYKLKDAEFRVQSISFDGMSLESEIHPQTKLNIVTGVTRPDTVSITWIEDVTRSVQNYHMEWFSRWYNRRKDCFVNGTAGKLRSCTITLFHYIDGNTKALKNDEKSAFSQLPDIEELATIELKGLIPASIGEHSFTMGETGASNTLAMNYKFTEIEVTYKGKDVFYI